MMKWLGERQECLCGGEDEEVCEVLWLMKVLLDDGEDEDIEESLVDLT